MDKFNKIQNVILWGFITFYFISLIINAAMAMLGQEVLAKHHWPIFGTTVAIGLVELTPEQKFKVALAIKNIIEASKRVVKKAARSLTYWFRAVCCLPALLARMPKKTKEVIQQS